MKATNHISFEELAGNIAAVFNQVREERKTVVVEYANGEQVVIKPVRAAKKKVRAVRKKTKADYEAFYSAAGGWSDVDIESFIQQVRESRTITTRPGVEL